jgi:integrase
MKRDERTYANALRDEKSREKAYDLALSGGLSALVATNGDKVFYWRGVINGKAGRIRLGSYDAQGKNGGLNLAAARAKVTEIKNTRAKGEDPRLEARRREANANAPATVREAAERFKVEHLDVKDGKGWAAEAWRLLSRDVFDAIGDYRPGDVATADLSALVARKAKELRRGGHKGVLANRLVAVLSRFFRFCEAKGWIETSPAMRLEKPAVEKPRERFLSNDELGLLWRALRDGDGQCPPVYSDILSLLTLTGARMSEIASLRRCDVDLSAGVVKLAEYGGKTADAKRTLPIGPVARSLLARLVDDASARPADAPLFLSPTGRALDTHAVDRACRALVERLRCDPFTPHDLRRSLVTHLHESDSFAEGVIRRVAGHKARDVHDAVYNRAEKLERVRAALEWYERHVLACAEKAEKSSDSNVIALRA